MNANVTQIVVTLDATVPLMDYGNCRFSITATGTPAPGQTTNDATRELMTVVEQQLVARLRTLSGSKAEQWLENFLGTFTPQPPLFPKPRNNYEREDK